MESYLSLTTVFEYLKATPNSRCFVEGEQVLNSKHLILVGMIEGTFDDAGFYSAVKIIALCLQTSALLTGKPHQISGWLQLDPSSENWGIISFFCSCKAGACGRCKHVSATLLKCTRVDLQKLEKLSGTDLECYWKSQKKGIQEDYKPCPTKDLKCFKSKSPICQQLSGAQKKRCADLLMTNNPCSALSKHKKGRRTLLSVNGGQQQSDPDWMNPLSETIQSSTFLAGLDINLDSFSMRDCCRSTYSSLCQVDIPKAMKTCKTGSESWKILRKYRLTGSRCYSIYTYSKEDWANKSNKYFNPKGFTNKYVQHGIENEKEAREIYKSKLGYSVVETGFIICDRYPWLGVSPDGIVFHEGRPFKLLEIKCPFVGRTKDSAEFINECEYLRIDASGVKLKENHPYYAQVQLGMSLLNLKLCDFVVYSSFSKTFLNVKIPFDADYAENLIRRLTYNYFTHMIHFICENK